jgi:acyl-CoA hydrolase
LEDVLKNATWADALGCFSADGPIYLAGCCSEPTAFLNALEGDPDIAHKRTFTGVWIPGVNKRDPTNNGSRTAISIFASPTLNDAVSLGRVSLLPMHYSTTDNWLRNDANLAGGIFQVSPPRDGYVGLGMSCDFTPAVVASNAPLIGQINPAYAGCY